MKKEEMTQNFMSRNWFMARKTNILQRKDLCLIIPIVETAAAEVSKQE